ncbi:MAG TPA: hypothetical protein VF060_13150 [Trebonia sp.]
MNVGHARRRVSLAITAGVIVLAVVGFAVFELTGQVTRQSGSPKPVAQQTQTQPTVQAAPSSAPATNTTPVTPPSSARPQAGPLTPATAESFGPNGTADGDYPQLAPNVLTDSTAGWHTHWYATATFGELKPGTGLLLDMGATVTITSLTVQLGPQPGAVLELRAAQAPAQQQTLSPAAFQTVTTVTASSGTAVLTPSTLVRARYVLLWCTQLPPDGAGTYQLSVHHVTVEGQP